MTTTQPKQKLTFEKFLEYDVEQKGRYELADGEIVRILPTRQHETIAEFISDSFKDEVKRLRLTKVTATKTLADRITLAVFLFNLISNSQIETL